jgi:hypothetical protein
MDRQSILHRTLWLFAGAFAAAVLLIVVLIWLTMRKGAKAVQVGSALRSDGPGVFARLEREMRRAADGA